ncbi:MAG: glycosyl hydrolase, partial [Cyclobacteriaceae bacterium]|nr:glycosyl hydrolase [Cyclobacteriaceae bacterium]
RYDKKSGEIIDIKPKERKDDEPYVWNWDAPLLISPHSHTRLYFAANRLFKSGDRGNSWEVISPDLTRKIDRNKLPIMGKVWGVDAVAKHLSTTIYGNIVALTESPKKEGLLYIGTDDGLVQVTEDGGKNWRKQDRFSGVPEMTYVNMLLASQHEERLVYAAFNNHKKGDFKPYLMKSNDAGKSWISIASNLPERGSVYAIAEDHVNPSLLFAGTEFGVFFTIDGGKKWTQFKSGLPTVAIRDIEIQKRENDLVLASFGRSFYVLDDYSPLRHISEKTLENEAEIYPIKDSWMFVESRPLGLRGKAFMGESYYSAENPPVGAVFTFYLKDEIKTLKKKRKAKEKELEEKGEQPPYPTKDELRREDNEQKPYLLFTINDENGDAVTRIKQEPKKGVNRVVWNFRYPSVSPAVAKKPEASIFGSEDQGPLALPGKYTVSLAKVVDGEISELVGPKEFECKTLGFASLPAEDKAAMLAFQKEVSELRRIVLGTAGYVGELSDKLKLMTVAVKETPGISKDILTEIREVEKQIDEIKIMLNGDGSMAKRSYPTSPSITGRIESIVGGLWETSSAPTETMKQSYKVAEELFDEIYPKIKKIGETEIKALENKLEKAGAPYTPGRLPEWK